MSIEGGIISGGVAAATVSGPAIAAAPAFGAAALGGIAEGPVIGFGSTLAGFGAKLEAPLNLPSIDTMPSFSLKDTMPYTLGDYNLPIGGERFNPTSVVETVTEPLNVSEVLREVDSILAIAPPSKVPDIFYSEFSDTNLDPGVEAEYTEVEANILPQAEIQDFPEPKIAPRPAIVEPTVYSFPDTKQRFEPIYQVNPKIAPSYIPFTSPIQPKIDPDTSLSVQPSTQTEKSTGNRASQAFQPAINIPQEEQIEETLEEELVVIKKKPQNEEEEIEQESEEVLKRIVDKAVVEKRITEILEAAKKVGKEGIIEGKEIVGELPGQHKGNRSGELNIVDPRGYLVDGSLIATLRKLASKVFKSLDEVYKEAPKIVLEDVPVTRGGR